MTTAEKFIKPSHLEEGEVVTRFPLTIELLSPADKRGTEKVLTPSGLRLR